MTTIFTLLVQILGLIIHSLRVCANLYLLSTQLKSLLLQIATPQRTQNSGRLSREIATCTDDTSKPACQIAWHTSISSVSTLILSQSCKKMSGDLSRSFCVRLDFFLQEVLELLFVLYFFREDMFDQVKSFDVLIVAGA